MHAALEEFLERTKQAHPQYFTNCKVLEVGSYNINGSVRKFFTDCDYIGLDWREGPDVDIICLGHEAPFKPNTFDTIICCECLEHDFYKDKTIQHMIRLLKSNGMLIITAAGPDRRIHEIECGIDNHYSNIFPEDLDKYGPNFKYYMRELAIGTDPNPADDIRMIAIKK